jgi:hypothetical protein
MLSLKAEAFACFSAIRWARSWGMMIITVETGSQKLYQAIEGSDQDLAVSCHPDSHQGTPPSFLDTPTPSSQLWRPAPS